MGIPFYLLIFAICFALFRVAINQRKPQCNILLFIIIMLLSAVAGFRDDTVGKDLEVYGIMVWEHARHSNFNHLFDLLGIESGYLMLNWIVSRFTNTINWFFFVHQLIIVTFAICTVVRMKKYGKDVSTFLFVFFIFFDYLVGFNIMRQMVAMMIVFYGLTYLFERRYIPYFVCSGIAILFHFSAVATIVIFVYIWALDKYPNRTWLVNLSVIIFSILVFTLFQELLAHFITGGFIDSKYAHYQNQEGYKVHKTHLVMYALLYMPLLLMQEKQNLHIRYTKSLIVLGLCLTMFGSLTDVASRVATYVDHLLFMYYLFSSTKNTSRRYMKLAALSALLINWFYFTIYSDSAQRAIPYTSEILGI